MHRRGIFNYLKKLVKRIKIKRIKIKRIKKLELESSLCKEGGFAVYKVLDVCRYIINYSNEKDYGISNLKLQKLLYFVQAYFLCFSPQKQPCFEEKIEAWDFGPVVPEAYHEYKHYGSGNIPEIISYFENTNDSFWKIRSRKVNKNSISNDDKELIDQVVDKFSESSAIELVELTHDQAPWKNAYVPYKNNEITIESIRGYFDE